MSVTYDGKKIIPAPLVTVAKTYQDTGDGKKLGAVYEIVLAGTLLPFMGSPSGNFPLGDPSNAFWELGGYPPNESFAGNNEGFKQIQRKQEALRYLFRENGKFLEWQWEGQPGVRSNPRVKSINFSEGQWVDKCDYTIELETDRILLPGVSGSEDIFESQLVVEASEEWQFEEQPGQNGNIYGVTHTISARGIIGFDSIGAEIGPAWQNAKVWCDSRITTQIDSDVAIAGLGISDPHEGNYTKSTNIAEKDGSYAVTETWTTSPSTFYFEKSFNLTKRKEDDILEITYNGTVRGNVAGHSGNDESVIQAKNNVPNNSVARNDTISAIGQWLGSHTIPVAPNQKNITVNNNEGTVSFSFSWSTGDDEEYIQTNEAQLNFNSTDGLYTMTLTVTIEGQGETKEERLINAKANIPSNTVAYILACVLLDDQIPSEIIITDDHISKSTAINSTRGTARISWTWNSSEANNLNIQVETIFPQDISAKLVIPGRANGPIIQNMNTQTAKQVVVNYSLEGLDSKPENADVIAEMNTYGGIQSEWILESDRENWNPMTKKYSRSRTHTVKE